MHAHSDMNDLWEFNIMTQKWMKLQDNIDSFDPKKLISLKTAVNVNSAINTLKKLTKKAKTKDSHDTTEGSRMSFNSMSASLKKTRNSQMMGDKSPSPHLQQKSTLKKRESRLGLESQQPYDA